MGLPPGPQGTGRQRSVETGQRITRDNRFGSEPGQARRCQLRVRVRHVDVGAETFTRRLRGSLGKDADLVTAPGNPVDDISNMHHFLGVFVRGKQGCERHPPGTATEPSKGSLAVEGVLFGDSRGVEQMRVAGPGLGRQKVGEE